MTIQVIGGGLAGCEAAWQAAERGLDVILTEMKPQKKTPAHHCDTFAELVCSNSFKAARVNSAAGLLKEEDIPDKYRKLLGDSKGARINNMVCDIVYNSLDKDCVSPSEEFKEGIAGIRQFMFDNLYFVDAVMGNEARSDRMIKMLFDYHTDKANFDELPVFFRQISERDGIVQAVTDYIASMTDTYAMRLFEKIYLPTIWKD